MKNTSTTESDKSYIIQHSVPIVIDWMAIKSQKEAIKATIFSHYRIPAIGTKQHINSEV